MSTLGRTSGDHSSDAWEPRGETARREGHGEPRSAVGPLVYQSLHRYHLAVGFATGRRVLVLESGDGDGCALLAETASRVLGVERDPIRVGRARAAHRAGNLTFRQGAVGDLDRLGAEHDLVVAFDLIDQIDALKGLVEKAPGFLDPGGLLLVSVPLDRDKAGLGVGEVERLFRATFPHLVIWRQDLAAGSRLTRVVAPDGALSEQVVVVTRERGRWAGHATAPAISQLVVMASRAPLPPAPAASALVDSGFELVRLLEHEREVLAARVAELERRREPLIERLRGEVDELCGEGRRLEEMLARVREELDSTRTAAVVYRRQYETVIGSRGWRLLEQARGARQALRRLRGGAAEGGAATAAAGPVGPPVESRAAEQGGFVPVVAPAVRGGFLRPAEPEVSIVIPVFNRVELTARCLEAVRERTPLDRVEVIVVDDGSTDGSAAFLAGVEGLVVVRNDENMGFVGAVNRASLQARGRHLFFLNNDTEVQEGWLDALLDAMESSDDVGAVGSRLVYPDGRLQEAGGVIWQDGGGGNLGRGGDPDAPEYNFRREVDYCSAAALLVRRDLFESIGRFDARFAPAYYEDADLCLALRDRGYRVLYEPQSVVVHLEGGTHGTDDAGGVPGAHTKAHQYFNRHLFEDKWRAVLARHRPPGTAGGLLGGRLTRRTRVLVCDGWVPRHDRDAGSHRMTWIVRLLRDLGCEVTLFPLDGERREPYTAQLQRLGVEVWYGVRTLDELLEGRHGLYDLVVLSRVETAVACLPTVRRHLPGATVIYDAVDLEFRREARRLALHGKLPGDDFGAARQRELTAMAACDMVVAVTRTEAEVVGEWLPDVPTAVLPTVHQLDAAAGLSFEERSDLLFVGGFDHAPNVDAAQHLVHTLMPLIRRELDLRLWLVGSDPRQEIVGLQGPGVMVTGYVSDLGRHLRAARVFVSPLRYGAGMKGKNAEAMGHRLPVVTTTVGAEGMGLVDGCHALVRDDATEFAEAVTRLYVDRRLWEDLSANGVHLVRERWTPEVMRGSLDRLLRQTGVRRLG